MRSLKNLMVKVFNLNIVKIVELKNDALKYKTDPDGSYVVLTEE